MYRHVELCERVCTGTSAQAATPGTLRGTTNYSKVSRFMGEVGCVAASVDAGMRMAGGMADADAGVVAEGRGLSE